MGKTSLAGGRNRTPSSAAQRAFPTMVVHIATMMVGISTTIQRDASPETEELPGREWRAAREDWCAFRAFAACVVGEFGWGSNARVSARSRFAGSPSLPMSGALRRVRSIALAKSDHFLSTPLCKTSRLGLKHCD